MIEEKGGSYGSRRLFQAFETGLKRWEKTLLDRMAELPFRVVAGGAVTACGLFFALAWTETGGEAMGVVALILLWLGPCLALLGGFLE